MSRRAVGMMSSVLCPRGDVCKWVRLILHVGPFACQNLSLIVRGQCLHKADGVPKDVFCRLCETEKQRPKRCGVPLKSSPLQISYCKEFIQRWIWAQLWGARRILQWYWVQINTDARICASIFMRTLIKIMCSPASFTNLDATDKCTTLTPFT